MWHSERSQQTAGYSLSVAVQRLGKGLMKLFKTRPLSVAWPPLLLLFSHSCCCCVRLFATSQTAARQASLSFTISLSLLRLMSVESVMPSNHLILCHPLLLLPSIFASIRVSLTLRPWTSIWSQGSQAGILYQALSFYVHVMFST